MARRDSLYPVTSQESARKKARNVGKQTKETATKFGRTVANTVADAAETGWNIGRGFGEGLGLDEVGAKIEEATVSPSEMRRRAEMRKPLPEYAQYEKVLTARKAERAAKVGQKVKQQVQQRLKERDLLNPKRIKESVYERKNAAYNGGPEAIKHQKAVQKAKEEAASRNAEYDMVMSDNLAAIDAMDAAEDTKAELAQIAKGEAETKETQDVATALSNDTMRPYTDDIKKIEAEAAKPLGEHGITNEALEDYQAKRKAAQAKAEEGGALSNVDRRRRELEAYRFRAEKLAKRAQDSGYKNVTADSIMEKARQRMERNRANEASRKAGLGAKYEQKYGGFENDHGERMQMLSAMENDFNSNQNKKVMNQRGNQMLAEQKAREEAIRNNPQAAQRREALSREWGANQQNPSFAQADARARWAAKANADRYGNRRNIGSDMDAYVGSAKHGFDTLDNLNKGWGGNAPRSLIPTGSAADNFAKAYEFNQNYMKTQQDMMQAQLAQQQKLANQSVTVLNNTPPNSPKETNLGNAQAAAKAGAEVPQPEPIKG